MKVQGFSNEAFSLQIHSIFFCIHDSFDITFIMCSGETSSGFVSQEEKELVFILLFSPFW